MDIVLEVADNVPGRFDYKRAATEAVGRVRASGTLMLVARDEGRYLPGKLGRLMAEIDPELSVTVAVLGRGPDGKPSEFGLYADGRPS